MKKIKKRGAVYGVIALLLCAAAFAAMIISKFI